MILRSRSLRAGEGISRASADMRRRSMAGEMIGDELGGAAAIAERQTDAASGQWRNMAGGITDEEDVVRARRRYRAADRNEAASPLDDGRARKAENAIGVGEETGKIRFDVGSWWQGRPGRGRARARPRRDSRARASYRESSGGNRGSASGRSAYSRSRPIRKRRLRPSWKRRATVERAPSAPTRKRGPHGEFRAGR